MVHGPVVNVFVPATIGNVGPGFDVLGLAVDGLGDIVSAKLVDGPSRIVAVTGRDANLVPLDPRTNCAAIAAHSLLRRLHDGRGIELSFHRQLPISGGLGSSAAASVGGAYAAALATGKDVATDLILTAALDGEASVAGRHLDNIAPAFFGGLCVVLNSDPPDVARVAISDPKNGSWWLTLVSPDTKLSTKHARSVLPETVDRHLFVQQMSRTAGLVTALAQGDEGLARRSLVDLFAEPRRAPLIPSFDNVKSAALAAGALGCSISGAGPTVFALSSTESVARLVAAKMIAAFSPLKADAHVGKVATQGARAI